MAVSESTGRYRPSKVDGAAFAQTAVIKTILGERGLNWYNNWSGAAHHGPWQLGPANRIEYTEDAAGVWGQFDTQSSAHLDLCADLAEIVCRAVQAWAQYWGRDPETPALPILEIAAILRTASAQSPTQPSGLGAV